MRPPDIVRLAPHPLYTTYAEVDGAVAALAAVVREGRYLRHAVRRGAVT